MTSIAETTPSAVLPSADQADLIEFLERLEAEGNSHARTGARIVDAEGNGVAIPDSMFRVLVDVAEALKAGLAVTVAPQHLTLSTQEAADLLRISRTTLVRLLESGAIPFDKPSRHRKIRLQDLLEYRDRQRIRAAHALDDMVADAHRLGMYHIDQAEIAPAVAEARGKPSK